MCLKFYFKLGKMRNFWTLTVSLWRWYFVSVNKWFKRGRTSIKGNEISVDSSWDGLLCFKFVHLLRDEKQFCCESKKKKKGLISKSLVNISWQKPYDIPTPSATSLIVNWQLFRIILWTQDTVSLLFLYWRSFRSSIVLNGCSTFFKPFKPLKIRWSWKSILK